tara:strand:- start:676 stop:885 length:210 start_codon:yes stop_codon:yes gene_type:complete
MNIFGIGTDIIQVDRIKKNLKKKVLLIEFSAKKKSQNAKKFLTHQIVLQKDLQQKKHFQKHWVQVFQEV